MKPWHAPPVPGPARQTPGVEAAWRDALVEHGLLRSYPARSIIVHEGDAGDLLYLILTGSVQIFSTNEAGKVVVYDTFGPGDLLGEPTLDGGARSASVVTLEKTTCSVITGSAFKGLVANNPALAMDVIFRLIGLLRSSNEHVKSLALEDVYGRVVRLLMKYAIADGDRWVIHQKLTHQSIAEHVGSSREMVGRVMNDLRTGGYVVAEKGVIGIVRKPPPGW